MKIHTYPYIFLAFLLAATLGCAGGSPYGKLRSAWNHEGLTRQILYDNWQDYHIFWAGPSKASPAGVLFDPKGDDRKILPDQWDPVTNQEELAELMVGVGFNTRFRGRLYQVVGPDGASYGYVYTAWGHVYTKAVDPKTLRMENLPLPPIDYGAGLDSRIAAAPGP